MTRRNTTFGQGYGGPSVESRTCTECGTLFYARRSTDIRACGNPSCKSKRSNKARRANAEAAKAAP